MGFFAIVRPSKFLKHFFMSSDLSSERWKEAARGIEADVKRANEPDDMRLGFWIPVFLVCAAVVTAVQNCSGGDSSDHRPRPTVSAPNQP